MIIRILLILTSVIFILPAVNAQPGVHTARTGGEVIDLIRKEKLDLILPGAMRDNNVDMWIHVTRDGDRDPMFPEFGSTSGYLIFTDLGDRIERAVFGEADAVSDIDVRGSREVERAFNGYSNKLDPGVWNEITEFVAERDPKKIAVNTSDWLAKADGISHSQYVRLEKVLGPKYSERIISAENLITDFRTRRILREVTLMTNALEIHRQILERALSNEVITPGVTTLGDIGWWVKEELHKRNLTNGYSTEAETPIVLYSAVSDQPETRGLPANDGSFSSSNSPQYVLQRGDFLQFDNGLRYLDYFGTDYKRNAYIMREGETKIPDSIQHAFDRAIAARNIIREHIKIGKTGGQILQDLIVALEAADYIYTPFTDESPDNYMNVQEKLANTEKSSFSIDLHGQGNEEHGGSLVAVGPSIAAFRSNRDHLPVQENHIFSLEFMVNTNIAERPGNPIVINIEGNHVVSSRGVEFLHPPNEKILLIH